MFHKVAHAHTQYTYNLRDFSRPADTCEIFPLACRHYTDVQLRLLILIDDHLEMSEMSSILLEMDLFSSQSPIQWHIDIVVVVT